jgi:osmotically-inducible protein OsmY
LIASTEVRGSTLEVRAENCHIHVKGRVDHEALEDEVVKLVKNVPGVAGVTTNVYSVPPETIIGV